jgi:hypothetical protein
MNERIKAQTRNKTQTLDDFRAANCKAASCEECENNRLCLPYAYFSALNKNNRTDIERTNIKVAVELLEDNGFHVSDVHEERAIRTGTGYVIDDNGMVDTGAILLRVIPCGDTEKTQEDSRGRV